MTDYFIEGLHCWLDGEPVVHDASHVRPLATGKLPPEAESVGRSLATQFKSEKAIMGVFDEGCMGMYNAIIPDELLNAVGVYKERLSQSALYAGMRRVSNAEAHQVRAWLDQKGMQLSHRPEPCL